MDDKDYPRTQTPLSEGFIIVLYYMLAILCYFSKIYKRFEFVRLVCWPTELLYDCRVFGINRSGDIALTDCAMHLLKEFFTVFNNIG